MRIVGYVPDLMDRSRVSATGADIAWVGSPAELVDAPADLVILDLARPGVLDVVGTLNGRVVGFASHVDRDLIAAARQAGCQEVLARSAFFGRLREILGLPPAG